MSQDKREDDVKEIVKEETEPIRAQRCALAETGEAGDAGRIRGPVRGYVG